MGGHHPNRLLPPHLDTTKRALVGGEKPNPGIGETKPQGVQDLMQRDPDVPQQHVVGARKPCGGEVHVADERTTPGSDLTRERPSEGVGAVHGDRGDVEHKVGVGDAGEGVGGVRTDMAETGALTGTEGGGEGGDPERGVDHGQGFAQDGVEEVVFFSLGKDVLGGAGDVGELEAGAYVTGLGAVPGGVFQVDGAERDAHVATSWGAGGTGCGWGSGLPGLEYGA